MEDNKISQFIKALKFFELEIEEMTGQPGFEEKKGKVIATRKKGDSSRILCAYSTYDELLAGQSNSSRILINALVEDNFTVVYHPWEAATLPAVFDRSR